MKVAVFSARSYERPFFEAANRGHAHDLAFIEARLAPETVRAAAGFPVVCVFVNDVLSAPVLEDLCRQGTCLVALRCAGFNNVDLAAAEKLKMSVVRVP